MTCTALTVSRDDELTRHGVHLWINSAITLSVVTLVEWLTTIAVMQEV